MKKQIRLPSPQVSIADPTDGLLPASSLDRPLPVGIPVWDSMQNGYFVQLVLNGNLVGETKTKSDADQPGDLMTLELPAGCLAYDGPYYLGYRATNDKSGLHNDSPIIQLLADRRAPGAALLAVMSFSAINVGEVLTGQVPGYAGMAAGDTLQTLCNGVPGPTYQISNEDLTERPVQIDFSKAFLQSLGSQTISVTYQVTDRAGNQSILATPVSLSLNSRAAQ